MWSLLFALTWAAMIAGSIQQKMTPGLEESTSGSIQQKMTPGIIREDSDSSSVNVDEYLQNYGYMNDMNKRSGDDDERRTEALKLFQSFSGLPATGEADEDTLHQMKQPRCGLEDIELTKPSTEKWNVTEITYFFIKYSEKVPRKMARIVFRKALRHWTVHTNLTFKKDKENPIIQLSFVEGKHPPCPVPMDGPGGVLAHAYYPSENPTGGDIHFDDSETFKYKDGKGIELLSVAMHQCGHALGLPHDETKGSIMFPWYTGQTKLGKTDVENIKKLYD